LTKYFRRTVPCIKHFQIILLAMFTTQAYAKIIM
jgi:hypothetical protein